MKYIYNKFKGYTLKDCECQYCLYYLNYEYYTNYITASSPIA